MRSGPELPLSPDAGAAMRSFQEPCRRSGSRQLVAWKGNSLTSVRQQNTSSSMPYRSMRIGKVIQAAFAFSDACPLASSDKGGSR